jgi:hypothetical protein
MMERPELRLRVGFEDDDLVTLIAQVRSHFFSGVGSAYFSRTNLEKDFIKALRSYPLNAERPPMIEGIQTSAIP